MIKAEFMTKVLLFNETAYKRILFNKEAQTLSLETIEGEESEYLCVLNVQCIAHDVMYEWSSSVYDNLRNKAAMCALDIDKIKNGLIKNGIPSAEELRNKWNEAKQAIDKLMRDYEKAQRAELEDDLRKEIEADLRKQHEAPTSAVPEPVEGHKPTDPRLGRAAKHASFNPIDYIINHMRRNRRPNIE